MVGVGRAHGAVDLGLAHELAGHLLHDAAVHAVVHLRAVQQRLNDAAVRVLLGDGACIIIIIVVFVF